MYSTENLILAVKEYPYLWDNNDRSYHNFPKKEKAWTEICKSLCDEWDSFDASAKKTLCIDIKKKWANIRDYYRKDVFKRQDSLENNMKRYIYAPMLSFLDERISFTPKTSRKRSEFELVTYDNSNFEDDNEASRNIEYFKDDAEDVPESKHNPEESLKKQRISHAGEILRDAEDVLEFNRHNSEEGLKKPSISHPSPILNHRADKSLEVDINDDDTLFLLSLRSNMREMSAKDKLEFKIGILELLKKNIYNP